MTALKVWVGHMSDDPKQWFLVAAPTRDEALWVADQLGNIDTRSLHQVKSPFAMNMGSHMDEGEDGEELVFGDEDANIYWTDSSAQDWATSLVREPTAGKDRGMIESANESAARQHDIKPDNERGRTET